MKISLNKKTLCIALCCLFSQAAHASYWLECDVSAILTNTETEGRYNASIKQAIIVDGHANKGHECITKNVGTELNGTNITINVKGDDIPTNKLIKLKYRYYSGMGPNGLIVNNDWQY